MRKDELEEMISTIQQSALSEMAGGLAHEINNPLTVIHARSFQLTQMAENNSIDPEKVTQIAESITLAAKKIEKIIKSCRSLTSDGSREPMELVSAQELIHETLHFCNARFSSYGIDVEVSAIPADMEFEGRRAQLEQVLLNLLKNSFDAIQNLEKKWVRIEVNSTDKNIEILVQDSGNGIPPEVAEKIMEPFFTTKNPRKRPGLGLTRSRQIMREHQGDLFPLSNTTHTTFVMQFPRWTN